MTRLHVDSTACHGRGHCTELLPELLAPDEWGYPRSTGGAKEPEVPAALLPTPGAPSGTARGWPCS